MKKAFIFTLIFVLGFIANSTAETHKYYSTEFACKIKKSNGYWGEWSDWEESHCLICISLDRNVINIYSNEPQEFDIYDDDEGISEDENGSSLTLRCIDKDGLRCGIRLRKQNDGVLQLYVEYNNIIYVYCK